MGSPIQKQSKKEGNADVSLCTKTKQAERSLHVPSTRRVRRSRRRRRCISTRAATSPALIRVWLLILIVVTATVLCHLRLTATLPALPAAGGRLRRRCGELLVCAAATAASYNAAHNGEEDEGAHTSADTDDDGFVVVDPG